MANEYEVFSPVFDALVEPIVCRVKEDADTVAAKLRDISGRKLGTSCDWQVREVEAGKRPIPPRADITTPVLVDEVRKLMAKHGQSLMVTFAWNDRDGSVNISTAGDCRKHSEWALQLSQKMAEAAGLGSDETTHEDRRAEHLA
jgi:hypothetical protein